MGGFRSCPRGQRGGLSRRGVYEPPVPFFFATLVIFPLYFFFFFPPTFSPPPPPSLVLERVRGTPLLRFFVLIAVVILFNFETGPFLSPQPINSGQTAVGGLTVGFVI